MIPESKGQKADASLLTHSIYSRLQNPFIFLDFVFFIY